jgi:TonB-linked SusC/RagA family outer membrane protein
MNQKWCIAATKQRVLLLFFCFFTPLGLFAQSGLREIKGTVVDQLTNESIPGVLVKLKRTNAVVTTNVNGAFSIKVINTDILTFSYVGYETMQIGVSDKKTMKVSLKQEQRSLDEVVVIGYGAVNKSDLTGSVGQVDLGDITKAPVASFSEALAGRVAGVQVSSNDGQPGGAQNIVIRGVGSLTQDTSPLYVIDGFPIEDFDPAMLNNDDIEQINILKDASATAIYGARGSNGVVIIETKKGKVGKPVVTFNPRFGIQRPKKFVEMMDPYEFVKYYSEVKPATTFDRYFKPLTTGGLDRTLESYRDVVGIDWQKEVLKKDWMQLYDLAVRGGNEQTKYSISGSLTDQNGVVINTGTKRYQVRTSIDQTISPKIKMGFSANYSDQTTTGIPVAQSTGGNTTSFLFYNMWAYRPISGRSDLDLLVEDDDPDNMNTNEFRFNPVVTANNTYRVAATKTLLGNAYVSYAFDKHLSLKISGGNISTRYKTDIFYNSKTPQGSPRSSANRMGISGSVMYMDVNTWSNDNILTYTNTFKKYHSLTAMVGFSSQANNRNSQGVGVSFLPHEDMGMAGFGYGIPYSSPSAKSNYTLSSIFGRLNYNYKWKYLFTATFRSDGSSKFPDENKYGYFPSGAFAWNMMKEPFMKSFPVVSTSKFRASYGATGNNRVGDFSYVPSLTMPIGSAYSFGNATPSQGTIPNNLGNRELKWETAHQIDFGYDLGLFKNRLELTVDWYRKTTNDLLLNADQVYSSGFSSVYMNIGSIRNEGLEFSLQTRNIQSKSLTWTSNFNISFNTNKVLALSNGEARRLTGINFENLYGDALYTAEVGQPTAMFYGYIFDGVYQYADFDNPSPNTYMLKKTVASNGTDRDMIQPGDIKYRDINGDGVVNSSDLSIIGNPIPLHTGGFNNNLTYKGFDLNVFFQWSYGNQIYNANRMVLEGNGLVRTDVNQYASYIDRWSPENQTNRNYRSGGQGPIGRFSSRMLEDGSYLRLKTISVGYNLPSDLVKKAYLSALRLTVAAQNLITWTKYSGLDPEVSVRNSILTPGFDYSAYPQAQTIVFGLNAKF